jgi:hypothetical protein
LCFGFSRSLRTAERKTHFSNIGANNMFLKQDWNGLPFAKRALLVSLALFFGVIAGIPFGYGAVYLTYALLNALPF